MLSNFYLFCKKKDCTKFVHFKIPICLRKCNTESALKFNKIFKYQILKSINV